MGEKYGSYSDKDLSDWEMFPQVAAVLTSSAFGAWLLRRDKNIKKQEPKTDILDKIRAELLATAEMHEDGDYYLRDKWVSEIIDKYRQGG